MLHSRALNVSKDTERNTQIVSPITFVEIMGRDFFGTQSPSISTLNNHLTINIFERHNHEDWDHWTEVLRVGKT